MPPEASDPLTCVCVRASNERVLFQNAASMALCDNRTKTLCRDCRPIEVQSVLDDRSRYRMVRGQWVKQVVVSDATQEWIFSHVLPCGAEGLTKAETLTLRENDVVELIFQGQSNAQIAQHLMISRETLKTHLKHIYQKMPGLRDLRAPLAFPEARDV